MTEKFNGYIDDVRVTVGEARYPEKPKPSSSKWRMRRAILWGAIKYFFTGNGIWLTANMSMNVGEPGLSMEAWIKRNEQDAWEHLGATFDGKEPAKGYLNGKLV